MVATAGRYLRLLGQLARYTLVRELSFRGNFLVKISVEILWLVVADPSRQDLLFPCIRGGFEPLQLAQHFEHARLAGKGRACGCMLPLREPSQEDRLGHGRGRWRGDICRANRQSARRARAGDFGQ